MNTHLQPGARVLDVEEDVLLVLVLAVVLGDALPRTVVLDLYPPDDQAADLVSGGGNILRSFCTYDFAI